ncbi:MAG: hypothetical protein ACLTLW_09665, partial [Sutterella wadsworthensis]
QNTTSASPPATLPDAPPVSPKGLTASLLGENTQKFKATRKTRKNRTDFPPETTVAERFTKIIELFWQRVNPMNRLPSGSAFNPFYPRLPR